ncbi:MAG: hypothetical protein NZ992_06335 [Candidatus Korarchaeum sp.]|nr:hypothetical protein [Candidatus Korarchaeum sp.]
MKLRGLALIELAWVISGLIQGKKWWGMGRKIRLLLCPACGSLNIGKASSFSGWLLPDEYVCPDCGYRGPIVGEVEVDKDEVREGT